MQASEYSALLWYGLRIRGVVSLILASKASFSQTSGVGEDNGQVYLVFDLLHSDLHKYLLEERREKPLTPAELIRVLKKVAYGMDYLHENNILHLDLVPFPSLP